MAKEVNRLTNANVYIDGDNFVGKAEEVTSPVIKTIFSEHKALGMHGKFELPSGIDKMEAKIKWNSAYRGVLEKMADPYKPMNLQIRAMLEGYSAGARSSTTPYIIHLRATSKDFNPGAFKQNDNVEIEMNLNVTYVKVVIDGVEVVEYDAMENIYKVKGVDTLADFRRITGA